MVDRDRTGEGREQGRQERRHPDAPARSQPEPFEAVARLAGNVGNRGFAQLAREGAGLLPSGRVHPDVQAAIDQTRGRGSALDSGTRAQVGGALGDSFSDVSIHTDATAAALARSVDARAFTTGSDIYFGAGEYRPGDAAGTRLLTHELTHVVQQRGGPISGPLTVTEPGDAHEVEAEAVADELGG